MKAMHILVSSHKGMRRNHHHNLRKILLAVTLLVAGPVTVSAADFQVDSGDTFDLGGGTLDLECGNFTLQNGSVFNAGSGNIHLSGNWNNQGYFDAGGGGVNFNDACGAGSVSGISGATYFNNLAASTVAAHELQLESGLTQSIANALVLTGAEAQLLKISSTIPGNAAYFHLEKEGSQTISYVDVQDNHATPTGQWLARNTPEFFNSVDSGGNRFWFLISLEPIPTLSGMGLVILLLLLAAVYLRRTDQLIRT